MLKAITTHLTVECFMNGCWLIIVPNYKLK